MEVWPPSQSWVRLWTLHLSVTKTLFHIDTPLFLYWVCGLATAGCRNRNSELQVGQVGFRRFWCVSLGFLMCSFRVHRLCQGTTPLVHNTVQNLDRHYSFVIRCFSGVCCPGGDTRCWKYMEICDYVFAAKNWVPSLLQISWFGLVALCGLTKSRTIQDRQSAQEEKQ